MQSGQLGRIINPQGYFGGPPPIGNGGGNGTFDTIAANNLVEGQVVFPSSSKQLIGDPIYYWNNTTKTQEIGMGGDIKLFNTTDKVTNSEYLDIFWNGNVAQITALFNGTGILRPLRIGNNANAGATTASRYIEINVPSNAGGINVVYTSSVANGYQFQLNSAATITASSGTQTALGINTTVNQSGTAGYTALDVNPTETATGSGNKLLQRWAVGGSQQASMTNTGNFVATSLGNSITTRGASFTIVASTPGTTPVNCTVGNITVTLPTAASATGRIYNIKKIDANAFNVIIAASGAETIDGTSTKTISTQYTCITVQSDGTTWWVLSSA